MWKRFNLFYSQRKMKGSPHVLQMHSELVKFYDKGKKYCALTYPWNTAFIHSLCYCVLPKQAIEKKKIQNRHLYFQQIFPLVMITFSFRYKMHKESSKWRWVVNDHRSILLLLTIRIRAVTLKTFTLLYFSVICQGVMSVSACCKS